MNNKQSDILEINLIEDYTTRNQIDGLRDEFAKYKEKNPQFTETYGDMKKGVIVKFMGGYYDNILYTTEILAFDQDGDLLVLWDCYWFPVKQSRLL